MAPVERGRARGRKLLWAASAFVALLPLIFHLPFVSGESILYTADTAQLQYPRYKILCDALQQEGGLPLWQTWLYGGSPFHANPENPTLYPPILLFAAFCTPIWTINLTILLHLSLAALGMFFLVRRLWLRAQPDQEAIAVAGALVGACAFSLSFWTRSDHLNFVGYGATHALIPWVLLATDALLEGPRPRRAAGTLGLLLGFQVLTGGLYVLTYAAYLIAAWMLFLGLCGGWERARRVLGFGTLAAVCAALIVAGKYVPYREWIATTNRASELDYMQVLGTSLGGKDGNFSWSEVWSRIEMYTFFGTSLVLASCALPLLRMRVVRLAYAMLAFFVLLGLGGAAHRFAFDWLPLFGETRSAVRAWTGVNALLPLLIGLGASGLFARSTSLRVRPHATLAVGALCAALLAPCLAYSFRHQATFRHPDRFDELASRYVRWPAAQAACGKDWRALYVDKVVARDRNEQFISTALEVETPAGYLGHVWPRALEAHLYGSEDEPVDDAVRFRRWATLSVKELISTSHEPGAPPTTPGIRPGTDEENVDGNVLVENPLARPRAIEPAVVAAVHGDLRSEVAYAMLDYGPFPLKNASVLQLAPERALSADECAGLDLLVICGPRTPEAEANAAAMLSAGKRVLDVALPLASGDRARVLEAAQSLALLELERPKLVDRFERRGAEETLVTRTDAARGRWVVLSEPWAIYGGWTATASDRVLPIERADGMSSAVFVPAGAAALRADYAPSSVRVGLWCCAAGVILALALIFWRP